MEFEMLYGKSSFGGWVYERTVRSIGALVSFVRGGM